MFGKRGRWPVKRRSSAKLFRRPQRDPGGTGGQKREETIKVNYTFTQRPGDPRPYLKVTIFGVPFVGLLDSGASRTIVGGEAWEKLSNLGFVLGSSSYPSVSVANGVSCAVSGAVELPVSLEGEVKLVKALVVPEIREGIVFGIDFWRHMDIVTLLSNNTWEFNSSARVYSILDRAAASTDQMERLEKITDFYFQKMGSALGCARGVQHVINTGDATPVKQRYYPVSPYVKEIMYRELDKMLELKVVEPSNSAWSSPVVLVRKPSGETRFCIDYRVLNRVTVRDSYPLPYISMILDRLRDARVLSSIDLKSAYWQVPLEERSKEKTAFVVPGRGLFQFIRMPFGLSNAPATWQRLIDRVLGGDLEPHAFVYLDDIIIATPDIDTHLGVLEKVLERLTRAGLTVNREKCEFLKPELRYLGYIVDSGGLRVDPEKVRAILDIPVPDTPKAVRRFVGLASWYRRFIPNFAGCVSPLTQLTGKRRPFVWNGEAEKAFQDIKQCLVEAPILTCPDFQRPFIIQTDASAVGLGAVLSQEFPEGEKAIAYASRALNSCERKYSATELECLAVVWAVEKFRPYVEGARFTIITDHHSLVWLHNLKDPSGRLARWALRLQGYDYEIVHRKGREHCVPDALSRAVPSVAYVAFPEDVRDRWYCRMKERVAEDPDKYPTWKVDDNKLYKHLASNSPSLDQRFDWRLVLPKELRRSALVECHDDKTAGHLGGFKTQKRIAKLYYWPGMRSDVIRYVRQCQICQSQKPEQCAPYGTMGRREVSYPWQMVCTDIVGPLPLSTQRRRFLLVVSDCFTKYSLLFPLRTATSEMVKKHIEEDVFLVYGVPQFLICDNGRQYVGKSFRKMAASYDCRILYNANYHPQANPTERINRTLKTMIRSYVGDNHRTWDKNLPQLGFALRTAVHEVTGYSPAYLNFGRELPISGKEHPVGDGAPGEGFGFADRGKLARHMRELKEVFEDVRRRLNDAYQKSSQRYNLRRRPLRLQQGQVVWKRNFVLSDAANYQAAKLSPKFLKCRVVRKVSDNTYELETVPGGHKVGVWHVQDLKPHHEGEDISDDEAVEP